MGGIISTQCFSNVLVISGHIVRQSRNRHNKVVVHKLTRCQYWDTFWIQVPISKAFAHGSLIQEVASALLCFLNYHLSFPITLFSAILLLFSYLYPPAFVLLALWPPRPAIFYLNSAKRIVFVFDCSCWVCLWIFLRNIQPNMDLAYCDLIQYPVMHPGIGAISFWFIISIFTKYIWVTVLLFM